MKKIKLGQHVTDMVTGFNGIATARVKYLNGCIQYCVKPQASETGKMPDGEYIDHNQLRVTGEGVLFKKENTGGPQRDCPK